MSFSVKYSIKLLGAFVARFKGLIALGLFLGILSFFVFRWLIAPLILNAKTERIGLIGSYTPEKLPQSITSLISDGLTKPTSEGLFEPALAESWETPDKGKTWIFHLRDNIYWQNGSKVKSADIDYYFSDVEVEKPDEKTIIFKLKNPFSPFPSVVSKPVFKKGLLGTGDWQVKKINLRGSVIQEMELVNKKTNLKRIYKFFPTDDTLKFAFKMGKVDKIIDVIDPQPFDKWKAVQIDSKINHQEIVTLFFNTQDSVLSEKNIRQALYYAINREELEKEKAFSPILPTSWAHNSLVKTYDYDPEKAKKIINSLPQEVKDKLSVKISTTNSLLSQAEKISKMWQKIGVKTEVSVFNTIPDTYQALLVIFQPPTDPDQYSIWHSTQEATNYSKLKNPRIDALLEQGRSTLDLEERLKVYLDFQRFLLEDASAAFLYHPTYYTISREKVF